MTPDIRDRVRAVVAATFGVPLDAITDETSSDTIETWDSMNHLHLMVALEGEFDVSFDPEEAVALASVRAIEEAVRQRRGG